MGEGQAPDDARWSDEEVCAALGTLDRALGDLENLEAPVRDIALDAVAMLAATYGEALARLVAMADSPLLLARACDDELVGHLLVLHGLHPTPAAARLEGALDDLRRATAPAVIELVGVSEGVAQVEVRGGPCSLDQAVVDVALAAAPELRDVVAHRDTADRAFVPLSTLRVRS